MLKTICIALAFLVAILSVHWFGEARYTRTGTALTTASLVACSVLLFCVELGVVLWVCR